MQYFKISAKTIFDGNEFLPNNTTLIFNKDEKIIGIENYNYNNDDTFFYDGILCPGFINAHCHLELSHLKNKINQNTGLLKFILEVITKRHIFKNQNQSNEIKKYINKQENEGVVAIGDICNTTDTIYEKLNSKIKFHNFIEIIGFDEIVNNNKWDSFTYILNEFNLNLKNSNNSFSPHSPYSVSISMFNYLKQFINNKVITIHNQECNEENIFYKNKEGDFNSFYKNLNIPIDFFLPTNKSSIKSIINFLDNAKNIILVHNLFTNINDINFIKNNFKNIFFCICINANLYIQNKIPPINLFVNNNLNLVIGTDSLASNKDLSILEEIKNIQKYFKEIPLKKILSWATINGAKSLNLEKSLGSFELNKTPGLVGIKGYEKNENNYILLNNSFSEKININ